MPRRPAMDAVIPGRRKFPAVVRVLRLLLVRMQERSTAVICLLAVLSVGVAVVLIRQGGSLALITGRETTDDAYVRADQVAISSHIAGYVDTVPVRDNETVSQGQVIATIQDDDYRARLASAEAALQAVRSAVDVLNARAVVQRNRVPAAQADVRSAEAGL